MTCYPRNRAVSAQNVNPPDRGAGACVGKRDEGEARDD